MDMLSVIDAVLAQVLLPILAPSVSIEILPYPPARIKHH